MPINRVRLYVYGTTLAVIFLTLFGFTGCSFRSAECRNLTPNECMQLRRDLAEAEQYFGKPMEPVFRPHFRPEYETVLGSKHESFFEGWHIVGREKLRESAN